MRRLLLLITSCFALTQIAAAQATSIQALPFKSTDVKKSLYSGKIKDGKRWKDNAGEHLIILCETDVYDDKSGGTRSAKLFAYHLLKADTDWKQQWRVYDAVENCEVDVTCEFVKGSLSLTDADKDGETEISFLYRQSCKGDVSPDGQKLIMYEGANKYAIRGETTMMYEKEKFGGSKVIDKSFSSAPKPLLDFANAQWKKYSKQKAGE